MRSFIKGAFTLIEMLVVVAVIGILAALLLPAFRNVQESGRGVKCASNLHQLHLAVMKYGSLPAATNYWAGDPGNYWMVRGWVGWKSPLPVAGPTPGTYDWVGAAGKSCIDNGVLFQYAGSNYEVYVCSTHRKAAHRSDTARSYSMNSALTSADFGSPRKILFGDDRNVGSSPYNVGFSTSDVATWHSGVGSKPEGKVVFCDGHVERR